MQSPRWSLAAFNWQRRQHRHVATNAHHLPQLACGVLLAVTVLALLACGALRLAHKRQLHLEMWQEAAAGSLSSDHHPSPVQTCQLELDGSPWERHCQRLDRVCVDQGMLILYDEKYQQLDGRKAGRLPELLVDTSKVLLLIPCRVLLGLMSICTAVLYWAGVLLCDGCSCSCSEAHTTAMVHALSSSLNSSDLPLLRSTSTLGASPAAVSMTGVMTSPEGGCATPWW